MVRIIATLLIWSGFTAITISLLTSVTGAITRASGAEVFGIVLVIALAAAISTAAVWTGTPGYTSGADRALAKAKRRRPRSAEDVLNSLDDEEIYELEALLLAREDRSRQQRP